MQKVSLAQLYFSDYNLKNLFAINQIWQEKFRFTMNRKRPTDGFLLFAGASAVCEPEGAPPLTIPKGALVHMAAGSRYSWEFHHDSEDSRPSTYLFECSLFSHSGEEMQLEKGVSLLDAEHFERYEPYFLRLIEEGARPQISPGGFKAEAYRLINILSKNAYRAEQQDVNKGLITRGIEYLEEDPLQEKSIAEIAAMCGISVNYFERLFRKYAGVSPAAYRLERKLERAEALLSSGDAVLSQIADVLNFGDSAYFCRVFHKKTGMTPAAYRKLHRNEE